MATRRATRLLILLFALLLLAGCGRSSSGPAPGGNVAEVVALSLAPVNAQPLILNRDSSTRLNVYGLLANGGKRDLTQVVEWRVTPSDRLRIDSGRILALNEGDAEVRIRYQTLELRLAVRVTTASLENLRLEPGNAELYPGQTTRFRLIGEFADGRSQDLTDSAQWTLEPQNAGAALDPATPGRVIADDDPTLDTRLTLRARWGGREIEASLQRLAARLQRLSSELTRLQLRVGQRSRPGIQGIFEIGGTLSARPVSVSWHSDDPDILAVEDGELVALAPGETRVRARYGALELTLDVQVSDTPVDGVEIHAPLTELAVGQSMALQAWAAYRDGRRREVTHEAGWLVTPAERAVIGNGEEAGRVLALEAGQIEVEAVFAGQRARYSLTLTDAVLEAIEISPAQGRLLVGNNLELQALGHYSDGSLRDLTDDVSWTVSDPALAHITTLDSPRGRLTALASGTVTVTATLNTISGSADFLLHEAQVLTLTIEGADGPVSAGSELTLRALAQLEDGSQEDLSDQVQWSSSAPEVLVPHPTDPGVFQALAVGAARISAVYSDAQGQNTSAILQLEVVEAPLQALALHDDQGAALSELTLAAGTRLPLRLYGHYQDGREQPLTGAGWSSADPEIARVIHIDGTPWLLGLAPGSTRLSVVMAGVSLELPVTVSGAKLESIALVPSPLSLPLHGDRRLRAIGSFSDGSLQDLSEQVVWESDDPTIAQVSNGNDDRGRVFGEKVGQTTLRARFADITGTTTVTVSDDPQALAGLSLALSPNVILDDPITLADSSEIRDQATIEVRLFALGEGAQVPDGTTVTLTLTYPDGTPESHTLQSNNGVASLPFTSPGGLTTSDAPIAAIRLQAQVERDGVTFTRRAVLWVVDRLDAVLTHRLYRQDLDEGTRLLLLSINLSNRPLEVKRLGLFRGALDAEDLRAWISIENGQLQPQPDPDGGAERLEDQELGENGDGIPLGAGQGIFSATTPRLDLISDGSLLWLLHAIYDPALNGYFPAPLKPFTLPAPP